MIDECPVLLPVPDPRVPEPPPPHLDPWSVEDQCAGRSLAWYMPVGGEWRLHRDPRLDLGFYTEPLDPRRRRLPRRLGRGDVIVFAAGLAWFPEGFWSSRRRRREILSAFQGARRGVYAVALLRVEGVYEVTDWSVPPPVEGALESPHASYREPALLVHGRVEAIDPPAPLDPGLYPEPLRGRLRILERGRFRRGSLGDAGLVEAALAGTG